MPRRLSVDQSEGTADLVLLEGAEPPGSGRRRGLDPRADGLDDEDVGQPGDHGLAAGLELPGLGGHQLEDALHPGRPEAVGAFAELAVAHDVTRLALLSGRGEPEAERAEQAVRETGAELTVLRSTWFMQNFSEDYMLEHVRSGEIRLPGGDVPTPFLDADDIADVAVAALTDDRHVGELYELTGPRSLTFAHAAEEIAAASGREVRYVPVTLEEHAAEAAEHGVPAAMVELLTHLFAEVVDDRNADTTDGVRRALGREPRDFGDYAGEAAAKRRLERGCRNRLRAWAISLPP